MARSVITKIKELSTVWTLLGWLIVAAASGIILKAVADHNGDKESHPAIEKLITANSTSIALATQQAELRQKANDDAHKSIEKKQDRIILLLDNLTLKVGEL